MLNSDETPALSELLIIAPTGIYAGRVRTGINLVLSRQSEAKETKVRVILVAGQNWIQGNESYKAKFVDKLKDDLLETWSREYNIVCDVEVIPIDKEEHLTSWLLKELHVFFKTSQGEAQAFIDLTSAPKEWQLAAINVLNFFAGVELYYVKPKHERKPSDYDIEEIQDEGIPKLQTVRTSEARQPLPHWMKLENEKEETNPQYLLFQTIFHLAQNIAHESGLDPLRQLHQVWVPIEEERGLDEYRNRLTTELRRGLLDDAALRKSISKHLTAVDMFQLFEVKGKSVRMTLRGVTLGQMLFGEKT